MENSIQIQGIRNMLSHSGCPEDPAGKLPAIPTNRRSTGADYQKRSLCDVRKGSAIPQEKE